ncbi:MAG: response regulator [Gaiellaceae bacterium]
MSVRHPSPVTPPPRLLRSAAVARRATFVAEGSRGSKRVRPRVLRNTLRSTSEGSPPLDRARVRRVLLVDDDASLRMIYRFNLQASGVEVVEAGDGETALRLLQQDLPDVLLLDVMMPGIDGWAVAEALAADPRTSSLPVIFITARADDVSRARGQRLGAAGFLTKPFNPTALADEIEAILRERLRDDSPER